METEGASLGEQLLEASRRNNVDLLDDVFHDLEGDSTKIAELINNSKDPFGNTALHLCCKYGSWDVLDKILDQEGGIEIDSQNDLEGNTPLHVAVKYAEEEPEHGTFIAQNLIEVGADPRIRNNDNNRPIDLIHNDELEDLIDLLQGAELAADNGGEVIKAEEENIDDDDDDQDIDIDTVKE